MGGKSELSDWWLVASAQWWCKSLRDLFDLKGTAKVSALLNL
jgi:hypothetical protein